MICSLITGATINPGYNRKKDTLSSAVVFTLLHYQTLYSVSDQLCDSTEDSSHRMSQIRCVREDTMAVSKRNGAAGDGGGGMPPRTSRRDFLDVAFLFLFRHRHFKTYTQIYQVVACNPSYSTRENFGGT